MKRAIALSLLALALSASSAPAAEESKPSSCAFVRTIDRWEPIDATHALIYTSPRRKFKLTFFTACRELKWALAARLDRRASSGTCLSVGDTLVFGRGALFPNGRWADEERCTITAIEAIPLAKAGDG